MCKWLECYVVCEIDRAQMIARARVAEDEKHFPRAPALQATSSTCTAKAQLLGLLLHVPILVRDGASARALGSTRGCASTLALALLVVRLLPTVGAPVAPLAAVAALALELLRGRLALAVLVVLGLALLSLPFLPLPILPSP